MLLAVGSKVRLVRTGDEGVVKALLSDGMLLVHLPEDDMDIPVAPEDVARIDEESADWSVKARIVPGKQPRQPKAPDRPEPSAQYAILNPQGIQLAFEPILRNDATPEKYRIFLLNDTSATFLYIFQLHLGDLKAWETQGKLGASSFIDTGYLPFEQLNDSPEIDLQCWRILDTGTAPRLHRRMKLKPANFFKRLVTAPLIGRVAHLLKVYDSLDPKPAQPVNDLRAYTRQKRSIELPKGWSNLEELPHEVWERAAFDHEIDLHIDRLVEAPDKIKPAEILGVQMQHFEEFLNRAIRVGAERIFVIHGVGEGKLRAAIARRLEACPEVEEFKNEYHPRYGWGATEVIF